MAARKIFAHVGTFTLTPTSTAGVAGTPVSVKSKLKNCTFDYDVQLVDGTGGGTYWKNNVPIGRAFSVSLDMMSELSAATGDGCIGRSLEVSAFTIADAVPHSYNMLGDFQDISLELSNTLGDAAGGASEWVENQIMESEMTVSGTLKVPKDTQGAAADLFIAATASANPLTWAASCAIPYHLFKLTFTFSGSAMLTGESAFALEKISLKGSQGDFWMFDVTLRSAGTPGNTFHTPAGASGTIREGVFEGNATCNLGFSMTTEATTAVNMDLTIASSAATFVVESYGIRASKGQITTENVVMHSFGSNFSVVAS